ncbi:MAG: cytochrome c [Verrucomicrobia bacterium]|nr:cytochrome c [Verrucomicrobiota bacterium]
MNRLHLLLSGVPVVLASVLLAADVAVEPVRNPLAGDRLELPKDEPVLKAGPGAELVRSACSSCHSMDYVITQPPLTRAQWTANVEKMKARFGAPLSTNEIPDLVEYLEANYSPPAR